IAYIFCGSFGSNLKKEECIGSRPYKVYQQEHAINNDFSRGSHYITKEKFQQLKKYKLEPSDMIMSFTD
ncbi:17896_t:CDS:1, partial [Gigaspora rosea]